MIKIEQFDKNAVTKLIKDNFGAYNAAVGILKNVPEKFPGKGLTKSDKFLHQKAGRPNPDVTVGDVFKQFDEGYGLLSEESVLGNKNNAEVTAVIGEMVKDINKGKRTDKDKNRLTSALQALIRNPIMRGDFGPNTPYRAMEKGFNKFMIATGTMFKNILAKVFIIGK